MKTASRTRRRTAAGALLTAGACALALTLSAAGASGAGAKAARTLTLNDSASLHKTSVHGLNLYEAGNARGSLGGSVWLHLDLVSTNHVVAQITVYPHGGSMSGNASASYHVKGSVASFSGTLSITRGTGSYSHARGSGLSFSGTVQRANDAVSVRVYGRLSY